MTKKIETLTPEQKARMPEFVKKWIQIGLSTEPADRKTAEEGINEAYKAAGLQPPKKIVWCTSPMVALLTIAVLKQLHTVWDTVGATVRAAWNDLNYLWGQHDASWFSFYDFMREVCDLKSETEPLQGLTKIGKSANWWWAYKDIVLICERHKVVSFDSENRLHREDGPSVEYPDGWGVYTWHGVRVPAWLIEHPETITIEKISQENNTEIRRIMIERYGIGRYMVDSGARKIDEDWSGELYEQPRRNDTSIYAVRVVNRTPESDGTYKEYWLRVDPSAYKGDAGQFAQAAVASTWRRKRDGSLAYVDWRDYHPQYES